MQTGLLIIDIQRDYFPGGKTELVGSEEASRQAGRLLEAFRAAKAPVFHVHHLSTRPGATFFLPGTDGIEPDAHVRPASGERVIVKHFPNGFRETPLAEDLRAAGVRDLVICGMMTHMCVDSSTRAAADLGFVCSLAHDACATRALAFGGTTVPAETVHRSFLAALGGAFAKVASAEELAARLRG